MTAEKAERSETPEDAIERIGFGPGQVFTVILSVGAIHFCDGVVLVLMNVLAKAMGKEFHLGPSERGMMTTMTFVGIFVGTTGVGYFGDAFGRRSACLGCYGTICVLGFATAFMPNFGSLVASCTLLGVGVGFGFPPSVAMASEVTPKRWRIPVRVGSTISFILGSLLACGLLALDDPMLRNVHWRRLLKYFAVLPLVGGSLAAAFLVESPVFLASVGRHKEAEHSFEWLRRLNGAPAGAGPYSSRGKSSGNEHVLSFREQLREIFSPSLRSTTCGMSFAIFCLQATVYGSMYAAAQVLEKAATLSPVAQMCIGHAHALVFSILVCVIAQVLARRHAMVLALLLGAVIPCLFAWAGSQPKPHSALESLLFQVGSNGGGFTSQIGMVAGLQLSVEAYPAHSATTSSSFIQGAGRLGAVLAPQLFENITRACRGNWTVFYYFLGCLNTLGGLAVWLALPTHSSKVMNPLQAKEGQKRPQYGSISNGA